MVKASGYVEVRLPQHENRHPAWWRSEHRYVMERYLGRALGPGELVHHLNGVKGDNRLSNLQLMDQSQHSHGHNTGVRSRALALLDAGLSQSAAARFLGVSRQRIHSIFITIPMTT